MSTRQSRTRSSQVTPHDLPSGQLAQLRQFFAVAQEGSFTRASKRLRIGQPAISRAIGQLEQALGVVLLERGRGRSVTLSAAGRAVLSRCEVAFAELNDVGRVATEAASQAQGELLVATHEHVAVHLLPPLLARMRVEMPTVRARVFTGPLDLLAPRVADASIEIGLFFALGEQRGLELNPIRKYDCKIVVAAERAHDPEVLASFIGSREIDDLGNRHFPTVEHLQGIRPQTAIRLSCNSLEAHKALVLAGCGISILPAFVVAREIAAGELRVIEPGYRFEAELHAVARPTHRLSRAARWLVRELRSQK